MRNLFRSKSLRILHLIFLVYLVNCAKSDKVGRTFSQENFIQGPNVRKNGDLSLMTSDLESTKSSLRALAAEHKAQLLEEQIQVASDASFTLRYKFKVPSESFSVLMDKLAALGHLLYLNIRAEDVSEDIARHSDRMDLLVSRLNEAKKTKDSQLIDSLQVEIGKLKTERIDTTKAILFSYITLSIAETTKIGHAFEMGFYYGREGFVILLKAAIITIFSCLPIGLLYLLLRLAYALLKKPWRQLLTLAERLGGHSPKINK